MHRRPLISIIVPIYKVQEYLSRCVESIRKQSYAKIEILLVDDGSPDKCPKICDNFALMDSRIKVIHKKNGGISSARNTGLDNMTGEYVTFIDSDDFVHPDFVRWLIYYCLKYNCDMAACGLKKGTKNNFSLSSTKGRIKIYNKTDAFMSREIKAGIVGKLYKASLLDLYRFPISDHFNYEDEALTYKLLYQSINIGVTDKKLYYYYKSPQSTTRNNNPYKTTDFIDVFEQRIQFFKTKEKELLELSWEYYSLCLMLFFMSCKKDKYNINNQAEILSLYEKSYLKTLNNEITPISYKIMFTIFYLLPDWSAILVNTLKLR